MGEIILREGNGCSQDIVNRYQDYPGLHTRVKPNDEARSATLSNVQEGICIGIFDSPDGGTHDDYCRIWVKKTTPSDYCVSTFEKSYEDEFVEVRYSGGNGLDGRVSYIMVF